MFFNVCALKLMLFSVSACRGPTVQPPEERCTLQAQTDWPLTWLETGWGWRMSCCKGHVLFLGWTQCIFCPDARKYAPTERRKDRTYMFQFGSLLLVGNQVLAQWYSRTKVIPFWSGNSNYKTFSRGAAKCEQWVPNGIPKAIELGWRLLLLVTRASLLVTRALFATTSSI